MERAVAYSVTSKVSDPAARLAIAASAVAFLSLVSLHVLSPEFSPAWRMISEYANGRFNWVLSLMFAAYGLASLALAIATRAQLTTRRGRLGLSLLVLGGIGQAGAAQFDLNQVALHEVAGFLGIVCLPLAALMIAPLLGQSRLLVVTSHLTWISVVVWIGTMVLMMATFVQVLGALPDSPPEELPSGVIALVGWANRLVLISAWVWVSTVACMRSRGPIDRSRPSQ